MDLTVLSGAATIALASAVLFLVVVRSWTLFVQTTATTRFPHSIMLEAAQRFRDRHEMLGREQSTYLVTGLVFTVVFSMFCMLPPDGIFENVPRWQLIIVLVLLGLGAAYIVYRLTRITVARRQLLFIRDANMATGHALQKLTANRNRVFHDVPCGPDTIDNVIVGLHGVYTVSVIARKPGKVNKAKLEGDRLVFAKAKEPLSVESSSRKSAQLASEIRKLTGHDIRVRSVIALPGWEISEQRSKEYLAVNERNIAMLTGWKDRADYLMNEDVEAIQKMLTDRCMRFRKT